VDLPIGYRSIAGTRQDRSHLYQFLVDTHRELDPQIDDFSYLYRTIDLYWSEDAPLWLVWAGDLPQPIACIWLGIALDRVDGYRHPYIFTLYVAPTHRRQGIAKFLMVRAETWAREKGYRKIGLQVLAHNRSAIDLYRGLSYTPESIAMTKRLTVD
jgi:ribosomal protein S18 acetylase RimI-like enzyme